MALTNQDIASGAVTTHNVAASQMALQQALKNLGSQQSASAQKLAQMVADAQKQLVGAIGNVNQQTYAPNINLTALSANARKSATKAVNPYYTQKLTEYLAYQQYENQRKQAQYQTDVKNLQDQLNQTLQGNVLGRTRTTQDVATNLGNIDTQQQQTLQDIALNRQRIGQDTALNIGQSNVQEQQFQQDAGQQFEQNRLGLGRQIASQGLTGGLAKQAVSQTTRQANVQEQRQVQQFQDYRTGQELAKTRNFEDLSTQEKRQVEEFNRQRTVQDLLKNRTFEDLAKSDELATLAKEKGTAQIKFDLDTYLAEHGVTADKKGKLTATGFETKTAVGELDKARKEEINQQAAQYAREALIKKLGKIKGAAKSDAAYKKYLGAF